MDVKGCCPLDCQDSCAWVAKVEDGRVTGVEGAKEHPVTRGVLCAKVKDFEARLTAPGRLLHPLRRSGPKGSGQFTPISWDEALDEIASRFKAIIAEHGAEALMPFSYLGSQGVVQRHALDRIFHALGASRQTGGVCAVSAIALLVEGHPIGVDPEETPDADLVILWGQNVLTTCHHQWHFIEAGAQARREDHRHRPLPHPHGEAVRRAPGAPSRAPMPCSPPPSAAICWRAAGPTSNWQASGSPISTPIARASSPGPSPRAAEVTGFSADEIAALAVDFAAATSALIRGGIAPQQARNGEAFVRGLSALAILGGHWRQAWRRAVDPRPCPSSTNRRAARADLVTGNAAQPRHRAAGRNPRERRTAGEGPHGVVGQSGGNADRCAAGEARARRARTCSRW